MTQFYSEISINDLVLKLNVGVTELERSVLQEISFTLILRFHELPLGSSSDNIADTVCYHEVIKEVKQLLEGKEFHLLEKIAEEVRLTIKKLYPRLMTKISVTKLAPPIAEVKGGISFNLGEF